MARLLEVLAVYGLAGLVAAVVFVRVGRTLGRQVLAPAALMAGFLVMATAMSLGTVPSAVNALGDSTLLVLTLIAMFAGTATVAYLWWRSDPARGVFTVAWAFFLFLAASQAYPLHAIAPVVLTTVALAMDLLGFAVLFGLACNVVYIRLRRHP